ncbi:MAG: hypothetical protein Q7S20_12040 [Gemmatimonadaceae bacterium]|nr:hypothetical protein [Gemmatimonadaceae bacterium]
MSAIAGMTAHIISAPRGECGIGPDQPSSLRGVNAARRIASSAIRHSAAEIQKIGSASV